jgi:hypothetical protein
MKSSKKHKIVLEKNNAFGLRFLLASLWDKASPNGKA